jgi:hypothetical protein
MRVPSRFTFILWMVSSLLAGGAAQAQGRSDTPQGSNSQAGTDGSGRMGATGWTGPHQGQTSPGHPDAPAPADSPDKQPAVSTGADLNGPPKEFPSNKTPE